MSLGWKSSHARRAGWLVFCLLPLVLTSRAEEEEDFGITLRLAQGAEIRLAMECDPPLGHLVLEEETAMGRTWRSDTYRLDVDVRSQSSGEAVLLKLQTLEGAPFHVYQYRVSSGIDRAAGDAVWSYNRLAERDIMHTALDAPCQYDTAPNRGIPFAAVVDAKGNNRLALGLLAQHRVASLRGAPEGDGGRYGLVLRQWVEEDTERFQDGFFVSVQGRLWYDVAEDYTRAVDRGRGYVPLAPPAAALNPTYDSWYWTLDRIDRDLIWDLARQSRALGFSNFLIDAGWDTAWGEYFRWLNGSTGDYLPPASTFPDFAGLVRDIRGELGMRVVLWMQPYALGRRSRYYPSVGGSLAWVHSDEGEQETATLCPRTPQARRHLAGLLDRISRDYQPDAFWFDWQEDMPAVCLAPHEHDHPRFGEAYNASQRLILQGILANRPRAFVDMRWPFANLNNKPYTHLWQPTDSPEDFEAMRLRAMNMRPFSSGVIMGTDEMYWRPSVSNTEAARYMAAVVFSGVPYFGPNLPAEPSSRLVMLSAWVRFYEDHRANLTGGRFTPYGDRDRPNQVIASVQEAFVYHHTPTDQAVPLSSAPARIYVVNASGAGSVQLRLSREAAGAYEASVTDLTLNPSGGGPVSLADEESVLDYPVPTGCLLVLRRVG